MMKVEAITSNTSASNADFHSICAKLAFVVYLGFLFFGSSMPFQEKIKDVGEIATSNTLNQYVFSILYVLAYLGLVGKWRNVYQLILKEKWLFVFIGWAFLSVLWSEYTFISFKRWVQLFGSVLICVSALLNFRDEEEALSYFKVILLIYIPLTVASLLFIPGAVHLDNSAWRGVAPHKNILGQACLISLVVWICGWSRALRRRDKSICLLYGAMSLVLLVGSNSMTSLLTVLILLLVFILTAVVRIVVQPLIGKFFSWLLIVLILSCYGGILLAYPEIVSDAVGFFGKEITLTGRSDLWGRVFEEAQGHFMLGWGYGGFWVINSPWMERIYSEFIWLPNQAHQGYLDLFIETGIIGSVLVFFLLLSYFKRLSSVDPKHYWKWFVIVALIVNITESTLLKANTLMGTMLLFSYLSLMVEFSPQQGKEVPVQSGVQTRL